jgi:hypothetical protein
MDGQSQPSAPNTALISGPLNAGNIEDQTFGTRQIGRRDFADRYFAEDKPNPMSAVWSCFRMEPFSFGAYRPLTSPDLPDARVASA